MTLSITVAAIILLDIRFIEQFGYYERPYGVNKLCYGLDGEC